MVDVEKTLIAIEEKKKWEEREEEILKELEQVRSKRKELKKKAKELNERIKEAENAFKSIQKRDLQTSDSSINLMEEIRRL